MPKPHRIGPFARHGANQATPNGVPADFHRSPVDRCEVFILWSDAEPTFSVDLHADNAVFPHVPKVPVATDLDKVRFGSGSALTIRPESGPSTRLADGFVETPMITRRVGEVRVITPHVRKCIHYGFHGLPRRVSDEI